jgi:hypothetical protein
MSDVCVVRLLGLTNGQSTEYDGQYLVEYDPGRDGVRGLLCHLVTTPDVNQATRFTAEAALTLWRMVDPRKPTRPDGKPNRPLTAFHTEMFNPEMCDPMPWPTGQT